MKIVMQVKTNGRRLKNGKQILRVSLKNLMKTPILIVARMEVTKSTVLGKNLLEKKKGIRGGKRRKLAESSDPDDSDEDWKKASRKKRPPPAKKSESSSSGSKSRTVVKAVKLSPELSDIVGSDSMIRSEVVKKMWSVIKERNLYVRT